MTRLRLLARSLGATLLALGLVLGVPAGLIRYVGSPLPSSWPTFEEIELALRSGIDPQLVVNTLAVIVWLVWLQLVATLTVEVVAVVKGGTARILPVLPGMQQTAARLVAAIALIGASLAPIRPPPAMALPLDAVVTDTIARHHTPAAKMTEDRLAETATEARAPLLSYTTRRLDTVWGIAERRLGDGRRWQEIRQLNPDKVTSDGSVAAGVSLLLPADATPPLESREVTVKRGDHFWSIAEDALTTAWGRSPSDAEIHFYWRLVIDANRDRLAPPGDPDIIYPGQIFQLPPVPAAPIGTESNQADSEDGSSEVTVQRGDHLWSIAETALTDAWGRQPTDDELTPYWSELIEANRDQLVNPDNPSLILPGQILHLPPIPPGPDTEATGEPDATEEPKPALEPSMEPSGSNESGSSPGANQPPELVPPSTQPSTPTSRPATENLQPDQDAEPKAAEPAGRPDDVSVDEDDRRGLLPTAAPIAGLGIVAAAVIALVDRLRRRQLQHRQPDTIPTSPADHALHVEAELRTAASLEAVDLVDVALRSLGRQIVDSHLPAPHVVGVHISDHYLKLLLWTPNPDPPDGWTVEDDGSIWTLPTTTDLTHLRLLADGTPAPYPSLVTAGHDAGSQLLLDLEFLGAVTITGTSADVAAACRTMAVELASSPIADHLQVVCVGFGSDLADLERVTVVDEIDDRLLDMLDVGAGRLGDQETAMLEARLGPGGDATYPTVIIDPSPTAPEGADRMLATAQAGQATAAVVGYPTGDRWKLLVSDGTVRVEPLGFTLARRDLTAEERQGVVDLIAAARDLEGTPVETAEPVAFSPNGHHPDHPEEHETQEPEPTPTIEKASEDLEVRVLGTIRIDGLEGHFASRKAAELPVYMALHRGGAEADTIMEALWPGEAPDINRFNRTTSRARTPLGTASNGELYLPRFDGSLYRVNPLLGCDLDRFTIYINRAGEADRTDDKIAYIKAALELVEGTPFSGAGNGYTWAWSEGLVSHAIVAVDDTAHHLARLALDANRPDLASWAARKGLLSATRCEECYRNLMRAAIAEGNQTALDAIFTELTTVVDADDGPDADTYLECETVELYERHSRRTTSPDSNRE